jgi:DNA-binding IclR family transcriptional regulator
MQSSRTSCLASFCGAIRKVRARLKSPPHTVEEYLDTLTRQGLVATAAELATFASVL